MSYSASSPAKEWRFWLVVGLLLAIAVWLVGEILAPFIVALLLAYLLDPLVRKLNEFSVPRGLSAGVALLLFIALMVILAMVIGPIVRMQVFDFAHALPGMIDALQSQLWPKLAALFQQIPALGNLKVQAVNLTQYTGNAVNLISVVVGRVLTGGWAFLHLILFFVLTPVITFYLLRDWPVIVTRFESLFPARHAESIHQELRSIDEMISGFVRGQATVSLCLAAFYSTTLYLTGLKYGMLIGLATGFLSFIPVVGTWTGAIVSLTLAFVQFTDPWRIALVGGVFVAAQVLDAYFLTPNLVGSRVGLHPVWIIFAILTGGTLFGFLGVIFAVPVAGTVAILLRAALRQYRASRYYLPS